MPFLTKSDVKWCVTQETTHSRYIVANKRAKRKRIQPPTKPKVCSARHYLVVKYPMYTFIKLASCRCRRFSALFIVGGHMQKNMLKKV